MTRESILAEFPNLYGEHTYDFSPPLKGLEIIREMCLKLSTLGEEIKIVQVKMKFGGLRVYTDTMISAEANVIIRRAENKIHELQNP